MDLKVGDLDCVLTVMTGCLSNRLEVTSFTCSSRHFFMAAASGNMAHLRWTTLRASEQRTPFLCLKLERVRTRPN